MKIHHLAAGVAIAGLAFGGAQAAAKHHRHSRSGESMSRYEAPSQPIAYSKLDEYLKASPHQRATRDWSNSTYAAAQTGAPVNAAATPAVPPPSPSAPGATDQAASSAGSATTGTSGTATGDTGVGSTDSGAPTSGAGGTTGAAQGSGSSQGTTMP